MSSTDPDAGGSITYSVVSGSLPSGISLNSSTGAITGTSSANFGIYNFTVRATDAGGNYVDRAFGIINNPLVDSDNFNRSTSGSLGSTTGSTFTWVATKGTWQADGSYATSSDSSSNNSMATITGATTNISNLQVDTLGSGGTGVSFWVTDANSWYALTTYYSSTSGTSTSCTGGNSGANAGGYSSACCGGYYTQQLTVNYIECCGTGVTFIRNTSAGCVGPTSAQINACNNNYGGYCGYSCDAPATYYYCSNTNVTTSYTNYLSNVRLIKNGSNLVDTTYSNNTSGYSTAGSVVISTSGNNITYSVYSGAGASGQLYSSSYTDSGAVKGNGVGIYKGNGGNLQGSSVDNFSVTLT